MNISTGQFLLWVLLWTPFTLVGQACGCVDCPATVPVYFNNFQLEYQVDGAVNDDLSGLQCVESVQVQFSHNRIQNLGLELVSPAGQTVTLVGMYMPFGGGLSGTVGAQWNVTFTPCGKAANPDPGLTPFWDNLHPAWSVFFGNFTGTYYPPLGNCLENFNTGSVNGSWQLRVTNYDFPPVTAPGIIEDFSINFCDETGINCCFPEGGTLQDIMPLTACQGDTSLQISMPPPAFSNAFDDTQYAYTFLLSRNDSIIGLGDDFQLQDSIAGSYKIQGLTYTQVDSLIIPTLLGQPTSLLTNLAFCAALSSNFREIQILPIPTPLFRTETICAGERFLIAGQSFDTTGNYDILLPATTSCDTFLTLQLNVLEADTTLMDTTLCSGEILQIATQNFGQAGMYEVMLQNAMGCDSLIQINLAVQALELNIETPPSLTCSTESVDIIANANGSNNFVYEWLLNGNTVGNTNSINVSEAGIYVLSVEDPTNNCSSQDSVRVLDDSQAPQLNLPTEITLLCNQNTFTPDLGTVENDVIYTWRDVDNVVLTNDFEPSLFLGFHTLEAVNTRNDCSATASIQVSQVIPPELQITSTNIAEDCLEFNVNLQAESTSNPLQYTWQDMQGNSLGSSPNIDIQSPGTYYLAIYDAQTRCTTRDSILIEEAKDFAIENAAFAVQQLDCLDNPLGSIEVTNVIGGQAPFVYALNGGNFSNRSNFENLTAANYQIQIQDVQGCEWDTLIRIQALDSVQIELGDDQEISLGQSLNLEILSNRDLTSIIWSSSHKNTFECPDCREQNLQPFQSTTYTVTVNDENGCTASDEIRIIVSREVPIYIPTAFSPNDDGQNDFFEIFPLTNAVTMIDELKIFNRWGGLVFEQLEATPSWDGRFQGQLLPTDTYILSARVQYIDGRTEMLHGELALIR